MGAPGSASPAGPDNLTAQLERWRRQGILSARQVEQILSAERREAITTPLATDAGRQQGSIVVEALGYLGGVLALAAALLLVQLLWGDLTTASRLAVPTAATVVLLVGGAMVPTSARSRGGTARLRSALWLLAVGACASAFGVLGDQLLDLRPTDTWLLVGLGALALGLPLHLHSRTTAQQVGLFVACMVTAGAVGARAGWDEPTMIGLAGWSVAAAWLVLAVRRLLQPEVAARYLGAAGAVVSVVLMAGSLGGQLLAIVTVAALFAWAVRVQSLGLLAVAAVGTLQVVPSTITFFFPDTGQLLAPVALLLVGGILVATAVTVTRRRARSESGPDVDRRAGPRPDPRRHAGPTDR